MLAFDFGEKRVGVAVGESLLGSARPLATVPATPRETCFAAIDDLLREWQPVRLVVGLPCNDDGSENARSAPARRFAQRLAGRCRLPVTLVNEHLTSRAADTRLVAAGITGERRKSLRDQVAAQVILQAYFDDHAPRS